MSYKKNEQQIKLSSSIITLNINASRVIVHIIQHLIIKCNKYMKYKIEKTTFKKLYHSLSVNRVTCIFISI